MYKTCHILQKIIYYLSKILFVFTKKKIDQTLVGPNEVALCLQKIGLVLRADTACLNKNKYYSEQYTYDLSHWNPLFRLILSPIYFNYFLKKYDIFIYIGGAGYLNSKYDGRYFEFKELKKNNKLILNFYTGSEIRSNELLNEISNKLEIDTLLTYQSFTHRKFSQTESREAFAKKLAKASDKFADIIFNPSFDQISYIKKNTYPFLYVTKKSDVNYFNKKFDENKKIIVHAPSSPLVKGTPLVRAAIKKLKTEGYDFEYIELQNKSNVEVIETLKKAHIVLNQFYAFVPGMFGIEAMSNNCVMLCSADKRLEKSLFGEANDAWIVTKYWQIYDNLKKCLESDMCDLKIQANKGTDWVNQYCSPEFNSNFIKKAISDVKTISQ